MAGFLAGMVAPFLGKVGGFLGKHIFGAFKKHAAPRIAQHFGIGEDKSSQFVRGAMSKVGTMAKDHIMREVDRRVNPNTHLGKQVESLHRRAIGIMHGGGMQLTGAQRPPQNIN